MTVLAMLPTDWDGGVAPAQAGPLGLVVILLLGVAVVFLYRSMNKHLRGLPESFDPPERVSADRSDEPPAAPPSPPSPDADA